MIRDSLIDTLLRRQLTASISPHLRTMIDSDRFTGSVYRRGKRLRDTRTRLIEALIVFYVTSHTSRHAAINGTLEGFRLGFNTTLRSKIRKLLPIVLGERRTSGKIPRRLTHQSAEHSSGEAITDTLPLL